MSLVLDVLDLPTDPETARVVGGGKAASLAVMARDLGLPVPPAFVITTEACREFLADGWPDGLDDELRSRMAGLEDAVGRRFVDPSGPLLVSVRSGAPVSMPGMMDTILNLGLPTDRATEGDPFTRVLRERLTAGFRDIVGIDHVPDDPWAQLRLAIEAVFRSWNGDRARAYRAKEGIPDDLGTAVTVQAMVFGNRGRDSATGVVFTRDPAIGAPTLFGDVLFDAQGEDVVAGTHATEPIAVLATRMPVLDAELRSYADRLERHYRDLCDIEFTIEDGRLWMLQVRVGKRSPRAALRIAVDMAEDPDFPLTRAEAVERVRHFLSDPPRSATVRSHLLMPLTTGLGASPGLASGPIVTDPEAAVASADAGTPAILVRAETSPDDVHGMARAAGILTSRGGLASHAAVVARGWGIPAVVGAADVHLLPTGAVEIGQRTLAAGEVITIDGASGEVFEGAIPGSTEIVPEARILLDWARELGLAVESTTEVATDPVTDGPVRRASPDRCLQAIAIKGFATVTAVADAVRSTPDVVEPIVDQLAVDGLIAPSAGAFRLTDAGTARATELNEADRTALGDAGAAQALDDFLALDQRMKDTVTAWQLRDPAAQVLNDHSDADYDRGVLERLASLHVDTVAWIVPLETPLARLADYRERLEAANDQAQAGDGRFVASPRVDSFHGIWFELHEDLIRLAGRTRAEEAEAGRA